MTRNIVFSEDADSQPIVVGRENLQSIRVLIAATGEFRIFHGDGGELRPVGLVERTFQNQVARIARRCISNGVVRPRHDNLIAIGICSLEVVVVEKLRWAL